MSTIRESYVKLIERVITVEEANIANNGLLTAGVVVTPEGPIEPNIVLSQQQFLSQYFGGRNLKVSDDVTAKHAYRLLASGPLLLTKALVVPWVYFSGSDDETLVINKINGQSVSYKHVVEITTDNTISPGDYHVVVGDYVFYKGVNPLLASKVAIEITTLGTQGSTLTSATDNILVLCSSVSTSGSSDTYTWIILTYDNEFTYSFVSSDSFITSVGEPTKTEIGNLDDSAFTIIPKYTTDTSLSLDISVSGPNFILTYDGIDYEFSLDVNAVDGLNQSIYIEYLNNSDLGLPFEVDVLDVSGNVTAGTFEIGNIPTDILTNLSSEITDEVMVSAISNFIDQEVALVDIFFDLGYTSTTFASSLHIEATNQNCLSVLSIPFSLINSGLIANYVSNTSIDDDNSYWLAGYDSNTSFLGFLSKYSAGILYIESLLNNFNSGNEFAPVAGTNTGRVSLTSLSKRYKTSEREFLLNSKVNTVRYHQRGGFYYINEPYTGATQKTVLTDEQNRRLANRLNRDLLILMEQFKQSYNTPATRASVVRVLTEYYRNNIESSKYRPLEYQIICDDNNNTSQVIRDQKLLVQLKVRYQNSIKFVEVLNNAYPVGVQF